VVQGPSATVAAVSAAVITPLVGVAALGSDDAATYAAALAIVTGIVYVALGVLRMGWVSNFLSRAVIAGFILGFAFGIIIDQSHKLFGVEKVDGTYAQVLVGTVRELPGTHLTTLAIGATSLAVLLVMRRYAPRWPRALIVMALSIAAVGALDLADRGVSVTGDVPTGFFSIGVPDIAWSDLGPLFVGAFTVIFVGFSESLAAARTMSLKHGYELDPNKELIASGAASGAAGLIGGFVNDGSLSKTSVADTAGQRTQLAALINAGFVLLTMLFLASLFKNLPSAALGAVVIDSMVGLITFVDLKRYFRVNRPDWFCYLGAMLGLLFLGIIQGVLIGVVLSLLLLIARASKPSIRVLHWDPAARTYVGADDGDDHPQEPGLLIVRVDGPLFFADANRFRDRLNELVEGRTGVRTVVVDADSVSQTDTDGADILAQMAVELRSRNIDLLLVRVHADVLGLWRRAGTIDAIGANRVYRTVRQAVATTTPAKSEKEL
jgi:high affinity sulfate transporter 1